MRYEKIKSILLTLLVLTSIILTWSLWTYQPNYETMENENYVQEILIGQEKELKQIIKPSKVVYHHPTENYGTTEPSEIDRLMKEISKWNYYDFRELSGSMNKKELFTLVHGKGSTEIIFPDEIPFPLIKNMFDFDEKEIANSSFDRMVIKLEGQKKDDSFVYFIHYDKQLVYEMRINAHSLQTFERLYYNPATKYPKYEAYPIENTRTIFYPKAEMEVTRYKYYTNYFDPEDFKEALFSDPSLVKKDLFVSGEEYTDGLSMMTVDYLNKMIFYVNPAAENEYSVHSNDTLEKSIQFINSHGGWTDVYRYAGWSEFEPKITYQLTIDGIPVFNESGLSEIVQIWGKDRVYKYIRPYFSLDIPIPSEMVEVALPTGDQAIQFLKSIDGFNEKMLKDLLIGYKMTRDSNEPKLIILEPSWYYQYDGIWGRISIEDVGGKKRGLE